MKVKSISQATAKILLKIKAVTFRFDPPYTYTSGIKSPIYTDNRLVISYPEFRKKICNFYIQLIKEKIGIENIDYISATATAAIPMGSWIAEKLKLPMVFVRPDKKSHGKENQIEGFLKPKSRVLIIEDLISTGGSTVNNAQAIRDAGSKVSYCLVTFTYNTAVAKQNFKENKLRFMTSLEGFL
ncbi:orotate phosphoribosyltransferase [Candidatus Beckwithbacteria bacterium]|nr:orotate phosphoribosyltransferase [Candidatus Beckwithbacteria bacterium]